MKELRIKDICIKGSSSLKQKDITSMPGEFPVYGASGLLGYINTYHQKREYIGIVKDGSGIGRVMFLPPQSSCIGTMQYILPKPGYDINYIGYCLDSLGLKSYKQGAAIPHIYFKDYGERIVNVVDTIEEQRAIVSKINAEFTKIDQIKQNAANSLEEAKNLMSLAITTALYPKSSWSSGTLQQLSTVCGNYGLAASAKEYDGKTRYIRITDITEWGDLNDDCVSADISLDTKQNRLEEGDILFARTGATVGKTLQYKDAYGECLFAGYLIRYRFDPHKVLPRFIFYYTHSETYYKWIAANQKVAAQPNISARLYNQLVINYPNVKEQQTIIERLDDLYNKVVELKDNYISSCNESEKLKQSILRNIFN